MSSGRLCWLQVGPPSAAGGATCLINTGCIKGLTDEPIQSFRFVCTEEGPGVGSLFACGKHGRLYRLSDGAMVSLPSSSPLWAALTEAPCALVTCDASGSLTIATLDMRTGLSLLPSSTFLTPVPDCVDGCVSIVPFSFPATYDVIACILSADGCGFIGCDSYPKEDTVSITTAAQPIEEVLLAGIASAHR